MESAPKQQSTPIKRTNLRHDWLKACHQLLRRTFEIDVSRKPKRYFSDTYG
jgi:hypothetical protein